MRSRQKTQDRAPYIDVGQRTDLSQRPGLTWSKREVGARIPLLNTYARLTRGTGSATMAPALYRRTCGASKEGSVVRTAVITPFTPGSALIPSQG